MLIKSLQDELGEEAEFNEDEDSKLRHMRHSYESQAKMAWKLQQEDREALRVGHQTLSVRGIFFVRRWGIFHVTLHITCKSFVQFCNGPQYVYKVTKPQTFL
jgi:hypothetical protein